jgi:hypothetical protein
MATQSSPPPAFTGQAQGLDERERQLREDYEWCLRDAEAQRAYAGQVVAVHQKKVWGAGKTHGEALQAALARPGCPPRECLAKVFVEGPVAAGGAN